jgi:phospholipase C
MRSKTRNTLIRNALLVGAAGAAAFGGAQVGCSSSGTGSPVGSPVPESVLAPNAAPADGVGTVKMDLTLPGGAQINSVNWVITGPNGATTVVQSGTVNVGSSTTISFQVGGIPVGSNYLITLSGNSTDGTVLCGGSQTFSITGARATTTVNVVLSCNTKPQDAGSAFVTASTFNCATWNSVSTSPSETTVGNSVTVSASASGPNPAALTYAWAASSGTIDNPSAAAIHFTCTQPGTATLTLNVGDGPVPDGGTCSSTLASTTVTVQCDGHLDKAAAFATATKIKHLVVIFGENISFDHYFGTYPVAQNNVGETSFTAAPGTPVPNGLTAPLDPTHGFASLSGVNLLTSNPVAANSANGAGAVNPFRLAPTFAATADQGHNYAPEQKADDNGAMDLFPLNTGTAGPPPGAIDAGTPGVPAAAFTKGLVMAYYDGNTLGTYWNLAQQYAMNDNSWTTVFGPSTPGAINLISGQTNGFLAMNKAASSFSPNHITADGNGGYTLIGDTDPIGDTCATAPDQNSFVGQNIGNLLNGSNITWGWFEGGFDLTVTNANNTTGCARSTPQTVPFGNQTAGQTSADYIAHHQPFQYYPSTANLTHARPSSTAAIGSSLETDGVTAEPANHQYDTHDFFTALGAGNLPAVVYLKAPAYQDGHPGYSNPIDEQNFVASVVTALQGAQEWSSTALVIAYDDSDGWYDHQMPPIVNPSTGVADFLNGTSLCTSGAQQNGAAPTTPLLGAVPAEGGAAAPALGRCGYGTRVPLMVVSPFAKHNYVDHTLTDQTSVLKFVEDNWLGGARIQAGGSFDAIAGTIQNMLTGI